MGLSECAGSCCLTWASVAAWPQGSSNPFSTLLHKQVCAGVFVWYWCFVSVRLHQDWLSAAGLSGLLAGFGGNQLHPVSPGRNVKLISCRFKYTQTCLVLHVRAPDTGQQQQGGS
jgi:hypothetical protein